LPKTNTTRFDGVWMSAMEGSATKMVAAGAGSRTVWPRETLRRICLRATEAISVSVSSTTDLLGPPREGLGDCASASGT
jgi:hypothetical protein